MKVEENKRKLIKSLAGGSTAVVLAKTLPDQWIRPVFSTVMVPAHATLSPCASPNEVFFHTIEVESIGEGIAEFQVEQSESEADFEDGGVPFEAIYTSTGGESNGEVRNLESTITESTQSFSPTFFDGE